LKVTGIIGSPNRQGGTYELVEAALAGARAAGAETELLYALDHCATYCHDCAGKTCWDDLACRFDEEMCTLNERLATSDALVLGAPVYFLAPNGIMRGLLDKVRLGNRLEGAPALSIALAGGTGKGAVLAVRSLDDFSFCFGLRALEAVPATRFNFTSAKQRAYKQGRALLQAERKPFKNMAERLVYYSRLKFADWDMVDENFWLTEGILAHVVETEANAAELAHAREKFAEAQQLRAAGEKYAAAEPLVAAYEAGVTAWHIAHK